jgi:hypothetical protein
MSVPGARRSALSGDDDRMLARLMLVAALTMAFGPAALADCTRDYKAFTAAFNAGPARALTGDRVALVGRQALRALDVCIGGDVATARAILDRLAVASPALGDTYWRELAEMPVPR